MPLGAGVRYRVVQTAKGPVRLAFKRGELVEAKNLDTGATHTPAEFMADHQAERKRHADHMNEMMRKAARR